MECGKRQHGAHVIVVQAPPVVDDREERPPSKRETHKTHKLGRLGVVKFKNAPEQQEPYRKQYGEIAYQIRQQQYNEWEKEKRRAAQKFIDQEDQRRRHEIQESKKQL